MAPARRAAPYGCAVALEPSGYRLAMLPLPRAGARWRVRVDGVEGDVVGGCPESAGLPLPALPRSIIGLWVLLANAAEALPRTLCSVIRVRGSRAAPAACRRGLREVVLKF